MNETKNEIQTEMTEKMRNGLNRQIKAITDSFKPKAYNAKIAIECNSALDALEAVANELKQRKNIVSAMRKKSVIDGHSK